MEAHEPFVPDEETCAIPPPSDPSSVLSDDLRKAEDRIFDDDEPPLSSLDIDHIDNFDGGDLVLLSGPIKKQDDLKVEEPLLPVVVDDEKSIGPIPDFGKIRHGIALDTTREDDVQCRDADKALVESLQEKAAGVMMEIEQEKLEPLDATIRVDVPVLDFSIPEPEWCKFGGDSSAIFKSIPRERSVVFEGERWSRKVIEESKMKWMLWTASKPRPDIEEPINDATLLGTFLELPADAPVPTSSHFARKKPGLAILNDNGDDDEDDLQPLVPASQPPPPRGDWMSLLKKRKLCHNSDETRKKSRSESTLQGGGSRNSNGLLGAPGQLLIQDEGAAAALLNHYLEIHAPKKTRLEQSRFFKTTEAPAKDSASAEKTHDKKPSGVGIPKKRTEQPDVSPQQPPRCMVCPEIPHLDEPLKMIVAVDIPRRMTEHLERLLRELQIVNRDYSAHNSSVWIPGSVSRTEVASTLADEADIVPSPSTGIILTTLIKLRQKQLPGAERKRAHLTSRVERTAARYERLVILVSEGNKLDESMAAMSASDAAAFVRFQAFAATLPAETTVFYVGGGVETLAKWAAAIAARHAAGSHQLQAYLREEETDWEVFLRRAGMNAYAAQVVLDMLRAPEGEPLLSHQRAYGLPGCIKLSQEQRCALFEGVLGGRRVLANVGRVVDASWPENRDLRGNVGEAVRGLV